MKRVVIVGGGISGLICSYVFRKRKDVRTTILEPNRIGGEFIAGGLKYIHRTDAMASMLIDLGLIFSNYVTRGGILLRGKVLPYPKCLRSMETEEARRIQDDHYRKTRLAEPGKHSARAMNDPASTKPRKALRTDFVSLIESLAAGNEFIRLPLKSVMRHAVILGDGRLIPYDYLVMTIPLWAIRRCVDWYVPHGIAMKLNIVNMAPRRDRFAKWDYVYTPYTPENAVHRFSIQDAGYAVEVNGELDMDRVAGDLNFIFSSGWAIRNIQRDLKGHLLPLKEKTEWPSNVAPIGRFAQWDSRITADVTLEDAEKLARRWFGG